MKYRPIGKAGAYPAWIRDLEKRSGVYVIREGGACVYVGSSVKNLRATLTRHFQGWKRRKTFWQGLARARDLEMATIRRLKPRDNLTGQPAEEVPF